MIVGYRMKRNPNPHASPQYFLVPVTAEPVVPAEGGRDALQEAEAKAGRHQGLLQHVREPDAQGRTAEPA